MLVIMGEKGGGGSLHPVVLVVVDVAGFPGGALADAHEGGKEGFFGGFEAVFAAAGEEDGFLDFLEVPHDAAHCLGADTLTPGREVDWVEDAGDDIFQGFRERNPGNFVAGLEEVAPFGGSICLPKSFGARDPDGDIGESDGASTIGECGEARVVLEEV